jgi:uncharacterized protein involved in tolerance to divalent cations
MGSNINIFYTTCGSASQYQKLSKVLLCDKMIICVNVIKNVESHYRDNGSVKKSKESILIIKTFLTKKKIENLIKKNHPYDIPFLVQLETKKVNSEYFLWALKNT